MPKILRSAILQSGMDTAVYSQLSFAGVPTLSGSGGHLPNLAVAGFRQTKTQSEGGLERMGRGTPAWPTPNHPTLEWPKPRFWAGLGAYRDCDDHCTMVVVILYAPKCCFRVQFCCIKKPPQSTISNAETVQLSTISIPQRSWLVLIWRLKRGVAPVVC